MTKTRELPIRIDGVKELTGFSRSHIYKLVHWKKIPCHKPTNGRLFFYESEILDFLARNRPPFGKPLKQAYRADFRVIR